MAVAQTAMVIALQSIPWHFSRAVLAGSFSIHELQALALTAKGLAAPSNHVTPITSAHLQRLDGELGLSAQCNGM